MKKHILPIKNLILSLLVLSSVFITTACPKQSVVRKAAAASYSLSGLTVDVIDATAKAYKANIISLETKDKFAVQLKMIAAGGKKFNDALKLIQASGENPLPDKLAMLNRIFSDEVVAPFLRLLEQVKVLTASQSAMLRVSIASLRSSILIISTAFETAGLPVEGDLHND